MINYRIDFDSLLSKLLKLDINSISWYYYIICITENSIYYLKKTFEIKHLIFDLKIIMKRIQEFVINVRFIKNIYKNNLKSIFLHSTIQWNKSYKLNCNPLIINEFNQWRNQKTIETSNFIITIHISFSQLIYKLHRVPRNLLNLYLC